MAHFLGKQSRRCVLVVGATALCFALAASGPSARSQSSEEPRYAPGGDLLLPNGLDTWVFVGSNLGFTRQMRRRLLLRRRRARLGNNSTTSLSTKQPTIISRQMVGFPRRRFW